MPLEKLDHFMTLKKELEHWSTCLRCSNELDIGLRSVEPFWSFSFFNLLQRSCFSCTVKLSRQSISNPSTLLHTCSACRSSYIMHRSCLWHPTSTTPTPLLFVKDESPLHCVWSCSNLICTSIFYSFFLSHCQQVIPSEYEYAKSQHQLMCQQCMQQHWRTINPAPAFCKVNIVHDLLRLIPNSFSLTSEPLCLTLHV